MSDLKDEKFYGICDILRFKYQWNNPDYLKGIKDIIMATEDYNKEQKQANDVETKQKQALHKHIVNRWAYLFDNWQPIVLGIAMALAFNVIVTMFENVIAKIALIIHGG